MSSDAGQHAFFTAQVQGRLDVVHLPGGESVVHHPTVQVTGFGVIGAGALDAHGVATDFRAGLGEPLQGSALVPVFKQHTHDVEIGAGDNGIDAQYFAIAQGLFDAGVGEVMAHVPVNLGRLVREPAEWVTADNKAADRGIFKLNVLHICLH